MAGLDFYGKGFKKYQKSPLYDPASADAFKISRSKIDLFFQCPRCFYLDRKLGISRPRLPGFTLNSAVDALLKNEFDILREKGEAHSLMKKYDIDAVPYRHKDIELWRNTFKGASYFDQENNFIITGAIDDIWQDKEGKLLIVDYKSTSTTPPITLDGKWKEGYKRQMEVYQWIFRNNGFPVSDTGYFVYANAGKNRPSFDGKLEFELTILPYKGDGAWIGPILDKMKKCLNSDSVPESGAECEHCAFNKKVAEHV